MYFSITVQPEKDFRPLLFQTNNIFLFYRINMVEAYLPIHEQVKYYECSDFPFNFKLIGLRPAHLRPLSAQTVLNQIHQWLDNTPKGKLPNWVVS